MFQGKYNDKQKHDPDFDLVVERALAAGVERMIGSDVPPPCADFSFHHAQVAERGINSYLVLPHHLSLKPREILATVIGDH